MNNRGQLFSRQVEKAQKADRNIIAELVCDIFLSDIPCRLLNDEQLLIFPSYRSLVLMKE